MYAKEVFLACFDKVNIMSKWHEGNQFTRNPSLMLVGKSTQVNANEQHNS